MDTTTKPVTKAEQTRRDKTEAIEKLRKFLPPGSTLYTVLRHVSRSGMLRHIDAYTFVDGIKLYLSGYIATAVGYSRTHDGALKANGCGMDMGYEVMYNTARTIYGDSFPCTGGDKCPSNDHNNGDREYTKGKPHSDGGYSLRHEWI
jgi:hypothetical protein